MTHQHRGSIALLLIVVLAFAIGACTSSAPAPPPPAGFRSFAFVVETVDKDDLPTVRRVHVEVNGLGRDGKPALRVDPTTGERLPLIDMEVSTPWHHVVNLDPEVISASLTVSFFGQHEETVQCYVEEGGQRVASSVTVGTIVGQPQGGFVQISCLH